MTSKPKDAPSITLCFADNDAEKALARELNYDLRHIYFLAVEPAAKSVSIGLKRERIGQLIDSAKLTTGYCLKLIRCSAHIALLDRQLKSLGELPCFQSLKKLLCNLLGLSLSVFRLGPPPRKSYR